MPEFLYWFETAATQLGIQSQPWAQAEIVRDPDADLLVVTWGPWQGRLVLVEDTLSGNSGPPAFTQTEEGDLCGEGEVTHASHALTLLSWLAGFDTEVV